MKEPPENEAAPPPPSKGATSRTINKKSGNTSESGNQAKGKAIDLASLGIEVVPDYYHEPSERFLVFTESGRWLSLPGASYKRILASRGVNTTKQKGEAMSEADHIMVQVQTQYDIARYGPLCGRLPGFYEENGTRHLVTEPMILIDPKPGDWPVIRKIITGLLTGAEDPDIGEAQRHTFLGWLQSSVQALRNYSYQQQQAIVFAGPKDCGKSLIQHQIITPCLAGRAVDAERFFLRGNDFNGELYKGEHLTLDDCAASTRISDRNTFGARLKGTTVGSAVGSLHAKGRDAVSIRPWWRVSITCNDQPENLMVLPPLNADVADKLILLRAHPFDMPMPTTTTSDRELFAAAIRSEIPAFLHYLLNSYVLPEKYSDPRRYNVATYQHPEIVRALDGLSPEAELLELIDATIGDLISTGPTWTTAAELETMIRKEHPIRAADVFTFSQACAKYLQRLSVKYPQRVQKDRKEHQNGWIIRPAGGSGG